MSDIVVRVVVFSLLGMGVWALMVVILPALASFLLGVRPYLRCPHCGEIAEYERFQKTYRSEEPSP